METMWSTYAKEQQKIGEEKGIAIGEAKASERISKAFEMLADGKTVQEIADVLDIPLAQAEKCAKIIEEFKES